MKSIISILVIEDVPSITIGLERRLVPVENNYNFNKYILRPDKSIDEMAREIVKLINKNNITHIISCGVFANVIFIDNLIRRNGSFNKIDKLLIKVIAKLSIEDLQHIRSFIIYIYDPSSLALREDFRKLRKKIAQVVSNKIDSVRDNIYDNNIRTIETSSIFRRPGNLGMFPYGAGEVCIIGTKDVCEFYGEFLADVLQDMINYDEQLTEKLNPYSYNKIENYKILKFIRSFETLKNEINVKVGSVSCYGNLYGKEEYLVDVPFKIYYEKINKYIEDEGLDKIFYKKSDLNTSDFAQDEVMFKYEVYDDERLFLLEDPTGDSAENELYKQWLPLLHSAIFYCKEESWKLALLENKPVNKPISNVTIFFSFSPIKEVSFKGTYNFTLFSENNTIEIDELRSLAINNYAPLLYSILNELTLPFKNAEVRKQALYSAVAQIFARNFAHNIGSHVANRATNRMAKKRITELYNIGASILKENDQIEFWLDYMSEKLDLFEVTRNEFLAEYVLPTKNAMLYRNILLPFCENTLLMDNIAHSEGLHYKNAHENRLKIKLLINDIEIYAEYPNLKCLIDSDKLIIYPFNFPYLVKTNHDVIDSAFTNKTLYDVNGNDAADIEICLTSEHALYSILENLIRNSAKHNKDQLDGQDLIITLSIEESEENPSDYYQIKIYDNISVVSEIQLNSFAAAIKESLITNEGEIQKKCLGIADIKINAHLLKTSANITNANLSESITLVYQNSDKSKFENYHPVKNPSDEIKYTFGFQFKLCKPKKLIWIGSQIHTNPAHRKKGVISYKNFDQLTSRNTSSQEEPLANYQFAILELDAFNNLTNELVFIDSITKVVDNQASYQLDDLLIKLPHRILLNCSKEDFYKLPYENYKALIDLVFDDRIKLVSQRIELPQTDGQENENWDYDLFIHCWANWLRSLGIDENNKGRLVLYFENEKVASNWQIFNVKDALIDFNFISSSDLSEFNPINDNSKVAIYDHHATGYNKLVSRQKITNNPNEFIKNRSWVLFDKSSSDFVRFFYPSSDKNKNHLFLLEAFDAAMCKISLLDERIAEILNSNEENAKNIKREDGFNSANLDKGDFSDLANNGNVFFITHFLGKNIIKNKIENFNFSFTDKPQLNLMSNRTIVLPLEQFDSSGNKCLRFDGIIIHRTYLLELFKENNFINKKQIMHELYKYFKRVVVISGGGYPHSIQDFIVYFKPYSNLKNAFIKYPSKISLMNLL